MGRGIRDGKVTGGGRGRQERAERLAEAGEAPGDKAAAAAERGERLALVGGKEAAGRGKAARKKRKVSHLKLKRREEAAMEGR